MMTTSNWYEHPQYIPTKVTKLTESEAAIALQEGWSKYMGQTPKMETLAILWSHTALETGRWKMMRNYNWGNIKKRHAVPRYRIEDDGHLFTMFATGENLWNKQSKKYEYVWFNPPHTQTHFVAHKSVTDGATHYIDFLAKRTRYAKAWGKMIDGDPKAYSHELKVAGYYTASEALYTKHVVNLTSEFMRKCDKLLDGINVEGMDLFTDEEREQILNEVGMSIEDYFVKTNGRAIDLEDEDVESYYREEPSLLESGLSWIKGKLGYE